MIAPAEDPTPSAGKPADAHESTKTTQKGSPTVSQPRTFEAGQKVKHLNGNTYEVRYQTKEGVALVGVANLVHPSALKSI